MSERHFSLSELAKSFGQIQTWTPELYDSSLSPSEGQTYTTQEGYYVLIGNVVYIQGTIVMSGLGTLTAGDGVRIGNFPYAAAGAGGTLSFSGVANVNLAATGQLSGEIISGTNYVILRRSTTTGGSYVLISELSSTATFVFSGWYMRDV